MKSRKKSKRKAPKRASVTPPTPPVLTSQLSVDNSNFPGSGADPYPQMFFRQLGQRQVSHEQRYFSKVPSDQIEQEIGFQEEQLASLRTAFPRVATGELAGLNSTEQEVSTKMKDTSEIIQMLKLELICRNKNLQKSQTTVQEATRSSEPQSTPKQSAEFTHSPDYPSEQGHRAGSSSDPEVAKRRALVKGNRGVPVKEMCEIFDRQRVPLPSKWRVAGLSSWVRAYENPNYRGRIRILISKDRQTA